MKKSRFFAAILAILVIIGLLAGCSAKSGSTGDHYQEPNKSPSAGLTGSDSESAAGSDVLIDRKLIRRINLNAETEDMDQLLAQVNQRVSELSGYIESRNIQNGSAYSGYRTRYAELTIRIPAENLDQFVTQVSGISNIVSTAETSDDVTLQYVATESRLKVLQAEEERLLEFLEKSQSVSEMLEIEARLTDVKSELESITSQLNVYDNLVDYGTITLYITEVKQYTVIEEEEPTMWEQIATGFMENLGNLGSFCKALIVTLIINLPFLVPIALIALLTVWLVKRGTAKKKKKKDTPPPAFPPKTE